MCVLLWIRFLTLGLCFSVSDHLSSVCLGVACRGLSGHPLEQWRRRYVLQILLCPKWLMAAPWLNVFGSLIQSCICSAKPLAANWTVEKALIPLTQLLTLFSKVLQSFSSAALGHLPPMTSTCDATDQCTQPATQAQQQALQWGPLRVTALPIYPSGV